jgi:hypothetical protein
MYYKPFRGKRYLIKDDAMRRRIGCTSASLIKQIDQSF